MEQCDNEENNSIIHDEELNFLDKSGKIKQIEKKKKKERSDLFLSV